MVWCGPSLSAAEDCVDPSACQLAGALEGGKGGAEVAAGGGPLLPAVICARKLCSGAFPKLAMHTYSAPHPTHRPVLLDPSKIL